MHIYFTFESKKYDNKIRIYSCITATYMIWLRTYVRNTSTHISYVHMICIIHNIRIYIYN